MTEYILSCDWGTSSFRLRLANTATSEVKAEVTSPQGIAKTFTAYQQVLSKGNSNAENRISFYLNFLHTQVQILFQQYNQILIGIPVLLSGMASSTIGIKELPYASLPFSTDATDTVTAFLPASNSFPYPLLLISGVKSSDDVMRGEETQLIGLAAKLFMQEAVCVFPGTHSKHIYISHQQITGFKTYMTGELFQTLASHTILQNSIEKPEREDFENFADAFSEGVKTNVTEPNLLHTLFTVRTSELFKKFSKAQNYYYLSGILIGQELYALKSNPDSALILCCGSNLLPFYECAIHTLNLASRINIVPAAMIDTIAIAGQTKILSLHPQVYKNA